MISPDTFGLTQTPVDKEHRRPLTLICKSLQNLSNNIHFGKKESYMLPMNQFIDSNLEKTNKFFKEFVIVADDVQWEPIASVEDVQQQKVKELHLYCVENIERIGRYIGISSPPEIATEIIRLIADLSISYEFSANNLRTCSWSFDVENSCSRKSFVYIQIHTTHIHIYNTYSRNLITF